MTRIKHSKKLLPIKVLLFQVVAVTLLLIIFFQDMKSRSVYWILFPLLTAVLLYIEYKGDTILINSIQSTLINLGFLIFQLVVLTIYFSIKNKALVNITESLLGWGDILLLISISVYLSVLNFLFFYIVSLVVTLLIWVCWGMFSSKKIKYIPLAGFQSLIFILFLASDWWLRIFDLTNDGWLLNLISK